MAEDPTVASRFADSQRALLLYRYGYQIDRSQRVIDRWEARWAASLLEAAPTLSDPDIDRLVAAARADRRPILKALGGKRLRAAVESLLAPMRVGVAERISLWYSREVSEDAGQHALDLLGINLPWSWSSRSASDKLRSAKGSKAIRGMYGKHVDRLTKIVEDAIRSRGAKAADYVRERVRQEWDALTKSQADLIAKTETAHMWEATSFLAYVSNGVDRFDWAVAVGGQATGEGVCKRCLKLAADGPYEAANAPLPPRHPLCRCSLVPALDIPWSAPKIPWTGGGS